MKKLRLIAALVVLFSFLSGLISCGPAKPTTPTSPTTPTTPTKPKTPTSTGAFPPTSPPVEKPFTPVVFKYGDYRSHGAEPFYKLHKAKVWLLAMEGATDGRIVIEDYPNGSLLNNPLAEMQVGAGIADIGYCTRQQKGVLPLIDVMKLPPVHGESTAMDNLITHWFFLYDFLKPDFDKMNLIDVAPIHLSSYIFITAKKPAYKMEDIKGMTLMNIDLMTIKLLSSLGAVLVPITNVDGYEALQKGMADGGAWNIEGPFVFGWVDAFKPGYLIDVGGIANGQGGFNALMNKQSYDRVPKDLVDVFNYTMWRWGSMYFSAQIDGNVIAYHDLAKQRGIQEIVWSQEEKERFFKVKEPIRQAWVKDMETLYKRGAEAAEILKMYDEAIVKYVEPAPVPFQGPAGNADEWNKVFGPGSTWGMGYKAYPNQTGLHTLAGGAPQPWK